MHFGLIFSRRGSGVTTTDRDKNLVTCLAMDHDKVSGVDWVSHFLKFLAQSAPPGKKGGCPPVSG